MKPIKQIFSIFLLAILPLTGYSWGALGHFIAGDVTDRCLTPKAKKKVTALLSNATVAQMSAWGDFVRNDADYKANDDWHYTDFEQGLSKEAFEKEAIRREHGQNVYRVGWLVDELKKNPNDTVALKYLIHLVQDLHCPMHLARPTDKGGNNIQLTWFGQQTNLHSLWDSRLIEGQKMSYSEYGDFLYRTVAPGISLLPYKPGLEIDWAWDSYLTTEQIYSDYSTVDRHYDYIFRYQKVWEKRLAAAGVRLAAVLNWLYK